jgi:PAS domain S-box-containing protein
MNGNPIPISYSAAGIKNERGDIIGEVVFIMDISKRKQAEEAVRKSEAKFRNIYESNMIGIIFWDRDGNILDANEAFLQMVGYTRAEILSGTVRWRDMTPPKYAHLDDIALEEMAIKGVSATFEKEYIRKDGSYVPILIGAAILEGDQSMGIAFVLDNTKRKQAEVELKKTSENLARSNSELQQFAYVASHDLQEPLRMVASYMQLLERRYKDKLDNDAQEFIAYAVDGATRMKTLINDLLQYSRIETRANPLELTDMENALNQTLSNLEMAIKETNAVITHDALPHIIADSMQMVQLLQNLIDNGIKFHSDKLPQIHIGAKQNENEWVFSVRDNGIGIDPQYFNRLFIIFQRLHSRDEYPGTGIGLAVCKRIVARHGGQIWVESEVGEGATFYFTIPIRRGESNKEK